MTLAFVVKEQKKLVVHCLAVSQGYESGVDEHEDCEQYYRDREVDYVAQNLIDSLQDSPVLDTYERRHGKQADPAEKERKYVQGAILTAELQLGISVITQLQYSPVRTSAIR